MGDLLELVLRFFLKILGSYYPEILIGLCIVIFVLLVIVKIKSKS